MIMGDSAKQSSDGAQPAVSVIIAVLNCEKFIAESVDSILNQTLQDIELIVVDDGSTDGTSEILNDYAARDSRVRVIRRSEAGGAGSARNAGIKAARADFIAIQDADDVSVPDRLERHLTHLAAHPETGFVASPLIRSDLDNNPIGVKRIPFRGDQLVERMQHYCYLSHCAAMFRTQHLREIGGYRDGLAGAEDYDLLLRLIEKGRVDLLDGPVYYHRQVPSGLTYGSSEVLHRGADIARTFARQRAERGHDDYDEYMRAGRMPKPSSSSASPDPSAYDYRLARAALDCGSYWATLRFVCRGLRTQPSRAPRFALLVVAAAARLLLHLTGTLDWFERTFRGR